MRQSFFNRAEMSVGIIHSVSSSSSSANFQTASVVTRKDFRVPPEAVWQVLMFYEETTRRPPLFLRWFLPIPLATEGCKFEVGGEVKCHYTNGHLLKRVTHIVDQRSYAFDVIEQNLPLGGIKVIGGEYNLQHLSKDRTRIALATRYQSPNQPRWLCRRLESLICHSFHRHILMAMQNNLTRSKTPC